MISPRGLIRSLSGWLGKPIASVDTDPERWIGTLFALPNPDPILREMGRAERVYYSIAADAHVVGDIRSIRGNLRSHNWRLVAGDEGDTKSLQAQQLCERWMQRTPPSPGCDWLEVMWQMEAAILVGYRPHEVIWGLLDVGMPGGTHYLPEQVIDRPARRIRFSMAAEPLLVSRGHLMGVPLEEPYQMVISRHMADTVNPYGVALLSSCFWPWTFKTGGWRAFVKYCERHGLPWPVGRYPVGTDDKDQAKLAEALETMLESSYLVTQEGNSVELLVPTNSGSKLPQDALIDRCNREMSKALTGQSMVSELQGVGARAASETAAARQDAINISDHQIPIASMGKIFEWITLFNFGAGVAPPKLELFKHVNGDLERAQVYQLAADMGARPSKSAMLEELGIPEAKDDADALLPAQPAPTPQPPKPGDGVPNNVQDPAQDPADFAAPSASPALTDATALDLATQAADEAIAAGLIEPVARMLSQYEAEGRTLAEFTADFAKVIGTQDDTALRDVLTPALSWSILRGAATGAD